MLFQVMQSDLKYSYGVVKSFINHDEILFKIEFILNQLRVEFYLHLVYCLKSSNEKLVIFNLNL